MILLTCVWWLWRTLQPCLRLELHYRYGAVSLWYRCHVSSRICLRVILRVTLCSTSDVTNCKLSGLSLSEWSHNILVLTVLAVYHHHRQSHSTFLPGFQHPRPNVSASFDKCINFPALLGIFRPQRCISMESCPWYRLFVGKSPVCLAIWHASSEIMKFVLIVSLFITLYECLAEIIQWLNHLFSTPSDSFLSSLSTLSWCRCGIARHLLAQ